MQNSKAYYKPGRDCFKIMQTYFSTEFFGSFRKYFITCEGLKYYYILWNLFIKIFGKLNKDVVITMAFY